MKRKDLTILAIETSCDDTGIAIVKAGQDGSFKILSNIVSSQIKIHKKYGGVFPALAKREHQKNLVPVLTRALKESKFLKDQKPKTKDQKYKSKIINIEKILSREPELLKKLLLFFKKYQRPGIDLIVVTNGPGLEPCLWTGVNFAKAMAFYWDLPIITVNHVKAHILINFLPKIDKNLFPAVALTVSGGHTQLILMKNFNKYQVIGETRDDAAGECFDKVARILGLGYPGGPEIARIAAQFRPSTKKDFSALATFKLPRPMINTKDYDFSFSGLKTAVLYQAKSEGRKAKNIKYIQGMCKEVQQAVIDVLIKKTIKAARDYEAKTIILGGGVTANKELRRQFRIRNSKFKILLLVPPKDLCTDNALMAAVAGYFRWQNGKKEKWQNIKADANLKI